MKVQIFPAASLEILHHTVWRTWVFITYSDEKWICCQNISPLLYNFSLKGWEWFEMYFFSSGAKGKPKLRTSPLALYDNFLPSLCMSLEAATLYLQRNIDKGNKWNLSWDNRAVVFNILQWQPRGDPVSVWLVPLLTRPRLGKPQSLRSPHTNSSAECCTPLQSRTFDRNTWKLGGRWCQCQPQEFPVGLCSCFPLVLSVGCYQSQQTPCNIFEIVVELSRVYLSAWHLSAWERIRHIWKDK